MALVEQVLARDIRSVHQRSKAARGAGQHEAPGGSADDGCASGQYHLVLEECDVAYDVDASSAVWVRGAARASASGHGGS